ncbi:MAG: acetyl-coenzyme A synthetase N-terminal domain-containing protein, partial [Candidatus Thermoplasmatota archaeon]|nr:acetyl-coenzyme A synthetase N-terminal domain-containing protein [Candidatus Thermoplasmatota archaeon]
MKEVAQEEQVFPPPEEFKRKAWVTDESVYDEAEDYQSFWEKRAEELVDWYQKWDQVLEKDPPYYKWFINGKLNISYNCLDRWIERGQGDKIAYLWEGERS